MAARESDRPRVRVAAAILDDSGRVVFVRHRKGDATYHLLPGGGVEFGESLAQAVAREVVEETGLAVDVGDPLFISDTIAPDGSRHVVHITFAARVTGGRVRAERDSLVVGVETYAPAEIASLDLRPPFAAELARAATSGFSGPARYLGSLWVPESGS